MEDSWNRDADILALDRDDWDNLTIIEEDRAKPMNIRELVSLVPSLKFVNDDILEACLLEGQITVNKMPLRKNIEALSVNLQYGDIIKIGDIEFIFTDSLGITHSY